MSEAMSSSPLPREEEMRRARQVVEAAERFFEAAPLASALPKYRALYRAVEDFREAERNAIREAGA